MRRRALTLVELLIVIVIIAVLIAILMPSLQEARRMATIAKCLSNMHHVLAGTHVYVGEFREFPYNWEPGVVHDEVMSHHCGRVYDNLSHPHLWSEGHQSVPFWECYLIGMKYVSAGSAGCAFSAPSGWDVFPASWGIHSKLPIRDAEQIRRTPVYVYRGPSSVDDARMDNYACGQIAWSGASDPAFWGRSGTWYPRMKGKITKPKPLFHCPVLAQGPFDGRDNYLAPHAIPYSFRNRLTPPMSGGGGRTNHYLAQSIG